jgi:hypothetical protein
MKKKKLRLVFCVLVMIVLATMLIGCTVSDALDELYLNNLHVSQNSYLNVCYVDGLPVNPITPVLDNYFVELDDFKDWGKAVVLSGSSVDAPVRATVFTGVTPSSSALRYCEIAPMAYGDAPARINWDKKLVWIFAIVKINDDAEFVGWMHIQEGVNIGQLVVDGIGIQVDNFNLTGETYGTGGRTTVPLTTVMASSMCYGIKVVHTPGVSDEFFVNSGGDWVSEGMINDPTLIPSGMAGNWDYVVIAGKNGMTGGVNNEMSIYKPFVWSER